MKKTLFLLIFLALNACVALPPVMEPVHAPVPQADVLVPCAPDADDGFGGTGCAR